MTPLKNGTILLLTRHCKPEPYFMMAEALKNIANDRITTTSSKTSKNSKKHKVNL